MFLHQLPFQRKFEGLPKPPKVLWEHLNLKTKQILCRFFIISWGSRQLKRKKCYGNFPFLLRTFFGRRYVVEKNVKKQVPADKLLTKKYVANRVTKMVVDSPLPFLFFIMKVIPKEIYCVLSKSFKCLE